MSGSNSQRQCADINAALAGCDDLVARLVALLERPAERIVLTTSFGLEDQVLTHAAAAATARTDKRLSIATLDTGRLFPETHDVWAATERRYGLRIACVAPDAPSLGRLMATQGIAGFRETVENRKSCCAVRKVEPLRQALHGADLWITGLRADQSAFRAATGFAEWDEGLGLVKVSPLADWTREAVQAFAREHKVPVNVLHARGFLSIGCAPCTRAVAAGEAERAGRWWWEDETRKECGLHARPRRQAALETAS